MFLIVLKPFGLVHSLHEALFFHSISLQSVFHSSWFDATSISYMDQHAKKGIGNVFADDVFNQYMRNPCHEKIGRNYFWIFSIAFSFVISNTPLDFYKYSKTICKGLNDKIEGLQACYVRFIHWSKSDKLKKVWILIPHFFILIHQYYI